MSRWRRPVMTTFYMPPGNCWRPFAHYLHVKVPEHLNTETKYNKWYARVAKDLIK
jgi:hypothetical protein